MPVYSSNQNVKSGVPLGGLGAGKMEIMNKGGLDNFTFLNNTHDPLSCSDHFGNNGLPGFHFAIFCQDKKKKTCKVLESNPPAGYPGVSSINYDGRYPFAKLRYEDRELPVSCELEAFSPLVPRDEKNSGLPAAVFRFRISNLTSRNVTVSLAGFGRNIIGSWCVGRFNQVSKDKNALSLNFLNKKAQSQDPASGEMSLSVLRDRRLEFSSAGEWNMQAKPFVFDRNNFSFGEAWQQFSSAGSFSDSNTEQAVSSESVQLGGAIAAKTILRPGGSIVITFLWSWFFPGYAEGKMYENWFHNISESNRYLFENIDKLYSRTKSWVKDLCSLKIDDWMKDALLNNLYPFSSASLWTKRGRFGFWEAPRVCPLFGTLDVMFYGSAALALFFPQLELRAITQFAEAQRPQGYIPHDLGCKRSDLASNSTNGFLWKDLNSKFILLAWRGYLLTGDEAFLRKIYPFAKKAFYWLCACDKDKDCLPDSQGPDSTFDMWELRGATAYTGGIFLCAMLALERMAQHLDDESTASQAREWSRKGRAQFEKKLWRKNYFIAYNDTGKELSERQVTHQLRSQKASISCASFQLVGQWMAHLLGLEYIVSPQKVKKALDSVFSLNVGAFGALNAVLPSGQKDKTCWHTEHVWFGMTYILSALGIYEGRGRGALEPAKRAWENAVTNQLNPWDQPDMVSSVDGSYMFGDHYMRNMVFWAVLWAMAKNEADLSAFLKRIKGDERVIF